MNKETQAAMRAVQRICEKETAGATPYPVRSSALEGCERQIFYRHMYPTPIDPNQWVFFQVGHSMEDAHDHILDEMGFTVSFPQGDKAGAHDPPDFVWTLDDVRAVSCVVHTDGMLGLKPDLEQDEDALEILRTVGVQEEDIQRYMKSGEVFGMSEKKTPGSYSFKGMRKDGPKDVYLTQITAGALAQRESGRQCQFIVFSALNAHVPVNLRSWVNEYGEQEVVTLDNFDDALWFAFTGPKGIQNLIDSYSDSAARFGLTVNRAVEDGIPPQRPTRLWGSPVSPSNVCCAEYCRFAKMCWGREKHEEGLAIRKRGKQFAKRNTRRSR